MKRVICLLVVLIIILSISCPIVYATEVDPTEPSQPSDSLNDEDTTQEDEDNKKWYDYLIDGISNAFSVTMKPVFAVVESLQYMLENQQVMQSLFDDFFEMLETWSEGFDEQWKQITDYFANLTPASIAFILAVWEFPIIKELTIGLVGLILIAAVFQLLRTF